MKANAQGFNSPTDSDEEPEVRIPASHRTLIENGEGFFKSPPFFYLENRQRTREGTRQAKKPPPMEFPSGKLVTK
jgi:hypothetical protein